MRFLDAPVLLCLCLLPLAAGCTTAERTAALKPADELVTGSVAAASAKQQVDPADAEIIKERVASSPLTAFAAPLEWRNEETGASGAITAVESFKGRHGQPCRSFRTSIANFLGVSLFEGETCEVRERSWILSWLKRFD